MFEEDQDTLAAEYVLGTLSAEEREHAEALLSFDPGFEAAVRQWERRLGELNVMVEAVEPPTEVWDKIKKRGRPGDGAGRCRSGCTMPSAPIRCAEAPRCRRTSTRTRRSPTWPGCFSWLKRRCHPAADRDRGRGRGRDTPHGAIFPPPLAAEPRRVERSADVIRLTKRVASLAPLDDRLWCDCRAVGGLHRRVAESRPISFRRNCAAWAQG